METNFYSGRLKRWNDDKGFGFIEPADGKREIFIHISALKRMSRRPAIGDMINYQIHIDNEGKKRAVNAKVEGVAEIQPKINRKKIRNHNSNKRLSVFFVIVLLMLTAFTFYKDSYKTQLLNRIRDQIIVLQEVYNKVMGTTNVMPEQKKRLVVPEQTTYSCNGKVYCSEMTSCEEAKFYLRNCPGTKLDGDGDGIPCESQWCDSW